MPPSGLTRLESTAIQLAASFDHMFPINRGPDFTWRFTAYGCWCADIRDGGFGAPTNRWGAFIRPDKFPPLELMLEEIAGLTDLSASLRRCRRALREVIRSARHTPPAVLIFADLFRELRRSKWTETHDLDYDESDWQLTCWVRVRRPNVEIVREMIKLAATACGGHCDKVVCQPAPADVLRRVFVPGPIHRAILRALDGHALRTADLEQVIKVEHSQMFRNLKKLRHEKMVDRHPGLGYYRPDRPPAELLVALGRHQSATK